jgi:tRNA A-37 threonylcarbamoyl transferase component Bud32
MTNPTPPVPAGYTERLAGPARLVVREDLAEAVRDALAPLPSAWERLGRGGFTARGRGGVRSLPLGEGLPVMVVRRYRHGGLLGKWLGERYLDPHRALTELAVTEAARAGGVAAPAMIGALILQGAGPFCRMALMSEQIDDSEDLVHYCCRLNDYPVPTAAREKRGVIREAARQVRRMHDLGIFHADLHLKNLLLRRRRLDTPEVCIIDFDKAVQVQALTPAQRFKNLNRMARSVRKVHVAREVITAWDKVRFLREYLRPDADAAARLRAWAPRLARAGRRREAWWTATGARRNVLGDRMGTFRS